MCELIGAVAIPGGKIEMGWDSLFQQKKGSFQVRLCSGTAIIPGDGTAVNPARGLDFPMDTIPAFGVETGAPFPADAPVRVIILDEQAKASVGIPQEGILHPASKPLDRTV